MTGLFLLLIGFLSGGYGVIVGAGGGFVFVPALLIFLNLSPQMAAGTGLAVVLINALSGVFGYVRQNRIDYKVGITLSIGAVPGTFIGVWLVQFSNSQSFYWIFALMLFTLGVFLLLKNPSANDNNSEKAETAATMDNETFEKKKVSPKLNTVCLLLIGVLLGVVSNYFGIGGGWLLVPVLIYIFRVMPHYATATSIFSLCLYSTVGVVTHIYYGNINWMVVLWGGLGVIFGAQLGVYLSNKISGKLIIQMLSILLIGVGIKLFFSY
ncbi:sulfite exporter TauE/SafE family protein [Pseudalkalibacillus decolorationis]|uniref:sulfite exporter TauE/SafE family protein n=1 Tax=Pseudalkalibacillus decolorationis TaxID=163879 RepID=UPI0027E2F8F3|nr:sulfite exporter TauE/SafE family protein [Pseudalkalibacillus decolorationis]